MSHEMNQVRPGHLSNGSAFRDTAYPDQSDFYDPAGLPAPHHLNAAHDSPYPSLHDPFASPRVSAADLPRASASYAPADAAQRGAYAPAMGMGGDTAAHAHERRAWEHIDGDDAYYRRFPTDPPPRSRRKWFIIGGILVALIVIIGAAAGVSLSKNHSSSGSSSSGGGKGSSKGKSGNPNSVVQQTDPNDPSTFIKDPALRQSFWGMAYTPEGSQLPACGNNLSAVIEDIQLMSQLTTRLRLYGADCNQSALVLEAIKQTKVDMTVWLGDYNVATDNRAAYMRQRDAITAALTTYGTDHVGGVTVGNEFMLNYLGANGGGADPNSAVGTAGAQILLADIADMRQTLSALNLPKTLQVGTSEAGSYFATAVLSGIDYGMANVHPWFANTTIADAAPWTFNFFAETDVAPAQLVPKPPTMWIAETGWPTQSTGTAATDGRAADAEPGVPALQTFLDGFLCQANANGTGYFFFEFADEPWKDKQFGGVEGWWGIFNHNKTLKAGLTIPTCSS